MVAHPAEPPTSAIYVPASAAMRTPPRVFCSRSRRPNSAVSPDMVVRQLHVADLCGEHPCVLWPLPSRVHDYSQPPREAIGRQWSLLISGPPEPHDTPAVLALDKAVGSAAQCVEPDRQGFLRD